MTYKPAALCILREDLMAGLMESMGSEAVGLIGSLVGSPVPVVKTVTPDTIGE